MSLRDPEEAATFTDPNTDHKQLKKQTCGNVEIVKMTHDQK